MIIKQLPTDEDIAYLGANMRKSDIEELEAVCNLSPEEAVLESVLHSDPQFLFAAHDDGHLICIGGCTTGGNPWLLGTDLLTGRTKSLTKQAKAGIVPMLEKYQTLSNTIDARQTVIIRWLASLGFTVSDAKEKKPGYPLKRFEMRLDYV